MDHVAILKPHWKLADKVISGEKSIESRWYMNKIVPWDRINEGDRVYFKEGKVVAKADVEKVLQFENLSKGEIDELLNKYGKQIGMDENNKEEIIKKCQDKKYGILIFLKNPRRIKPANINKKGFGNMAAWITVKNIKNITY